MMIMMLSNIVMISNIVMFQKYDIWWFWCSLLQLLRLSWEPLSEAAKLRKVRAAGLGTRQHPSSLEAWTLYDDRTGFSTASAWSSVESHWAASHVLNICENGWKWMKMCKQAACQHVLCVSLYTGRQGDRHACMYPYNSIPAYHTYVHTYTYILYIKIICTNMIKYVYKYIYIDIYIYI